MFRHEPASAAGLTAADSATLRMSTSSRAFLAMVAGVLLGAPWFDQGLYWTAWFGAVPLLFALGGVRLRAALLVGWLAGSVYFAIATYWIIDFVINLRDFSGPVAVLLGIVFWGYAGLSVGLSCLLFRWVSRQLPRWDLLSFPVCMVVLMEIYPLLVGTYYAEAQSRFLPGLQGVALLGVQGMDMLMMLSGALLFTLLVDRGRSQRAGIVLAASVLLAWFAYGFISLQAWDTRMLKWDTRQIGLVQPNDAVTLAIPEPPSGFSREYPPELAATERLAAAGAQLVIWPEARYKGYFDKPSVRNSYASVLNDLGIPLILHDSERAWTNGDYTDYNSLVHLDAHGAQTGVYRKMLRMPLGEYLPDFFHLPGISWVTRRFFGDFVRPLQPGTAHREFRINGMRLLPKICYEAAFPSFVAGAVGSNAAGKVLLFVSQDNWFGETAQPFQHASMSVVRGVENRLPMIHLINNGPSVVSAPNGRITARTQAFAQSEIVASMPFSATSGGSFYSRHPQIVRYLQYGILAMLALMVLIRRKGLARNTTSKEDR
jgi:apolipoprotein N-acyltransferase